MKLPKSQKPLPVVTCGLLTVVMGLLLTLVAGAQQGVFPCNRPEHDPCDCWYEVCIRPDQGECGDCEAFCSGCGVEWTFCEEEEEEPFTCGEGWLYDGCACDESAG